jgi:parvulin-like peptidyl-prolyl isomerase
MYKIIFLVIVTVFICSCSDDGKLKQGTPLYELAKELSQKVPEIDPDSNIVWISTDDFELRTSDIIPIMQGRYGNRIKSLKGEPPQQMRQSIFSLSRMLARNQIILKAAKEQNINYSQAKYDSLLEIQINRWGGPEAYKENIEKDGMKLEEIQQTIKEGLIIEEYMKKAIPESMLTISDEDIMYYYNNTSVSVRHILLVTQGKSEDEKEQIYQRMKGILEQAKRGDDFAQLATKYTEDPGSKDKGGFYEFGPGRMVPEFEKASFTTAIGDISDIIETAYGYHIIKVIDRKPEKRPLEEVRASYKARISKLKIQRSRYDHIESLKELSNYTEHVNL